MFTSLYFFVYYSIVGLFKKIVNYFVKIYFDQPIPLSSPVSRAQMCVTNAPYHGYTDH